MNRKSKSFLGQGWTFPPTFTRALNTVSMSKDEDNVRENLHILFSTQRGERIMNLEYGTILRSLVFEDPDGDLYSTIRDSLKRAIAEFEPRIKVIDVTVAPDSVNREVVFINVTYSIRTTNSRLNFVYPFHFIEGTNISE